ncbi:non-ribosomal peptide synthetase [Pedobacter roseus]|uniref:Amino acid adenylation domain-containing protein n=1 Tax=Pedobacter roseus TaxID=336820 RepID=A0A7G9QKQ9_9SPHI|nr:non-ribosomal peptide synthetase [Pedobacter roseus]QNN43934.1 amino acid adenylation domain-containing protein [Pedobacter roseus]
MVVELDFLGLSLVESDHRGSGRDAVDGLIELDFGTSFDLSSGPLLRAHLYRTGDDEWVFTYVMHHIISDGWSMGILVRELLDLYNGEVTGIPADLPVLGIQYRDYAAWEQSNLSGDVYAGHRDYWLDQLSGDLPVLDLWSDRPRPAVKTYTGGVVHCILDRELSDSLRSLCHQSGSTLFMGLLSVVNILLYRYSGQDDIIVGTPMAGREHPDLEGQIGFYVNTLALRTRLSGSKSFREVLGDVRGVCLDAYEHQAYPFDKLVEELGLQRDMSRNPLFDVAVVLQNTEAVLERNFNGLLVSKYGTKEYQISKFDLTFTFFEVDGGIALNIEYNSDLYDITSIERMSGHFCLLLDQLLTSPDGALGEADYIGQAERDVLLGEFNATSTAFPSKQTIVDLFEEQVLLMGDSTAVVFGSDRISYAELNARSNRLAHYLRKEHGIRRGELVGILLDRSDWMVVSILGVLKSGGAYVPIDPEYPADRIAYILSDSGCRTVIDSTELLRFFQVMGSFSAADSVAVCIPTDLAYVIYTSGSTGTPKGVMVEHRNMAHLVRSQGPLELKGNKTLLCTAGTSFDVSVYEYWGILAHGGQLVLCGTDILLEPARLSGEMISENVDTMWLTSGWLNQLVDFDIEMFGKLRTLIAGGDILSPDHINRLVGRYPLLNIVNGYGPTETTVFSTSFAINGEQMGSIPIGRPISNSRVYIIDGFGGLSGIGVPGEICVGGAGVARGYLNLPELTSSRFVPDPYFPGERMYLTGDLGRWLPDGNIEFLGRSDDQVKIRGYRVELGEIENVLVGHPGIESCVAAVRGIGSDRELVCYFTGSSELSSGDLRSYLSGLLPSYMVPGHYVLLASLPLTGNGKVDRRALPDPAGLGVSTGMDYVAPSTDTERELVSIWEEVLGREGIGVRDNFFELGGDSLKIIRAAKHMSKQLNFMIKPTDLFQHVNIRTIVDELLNKSSSYLDEEISANELLSNLNKFKTNESD